MHIYKERESCVKPGRRGKEREINGGVIIDCIALKWRHEEVPGTVRRVRRGSSLLDGLTNGADCKDCVLVKITQSLSHNFLKGMKSISAASESS